MQQPNNWNTKVFSSISGMQKLPSLENKSFLRNLYESCFLNSYLYIYYAKVMRTHLHFMRSTLIYILHTNLQIGPVNSTCMVCNN